MGNYFGNDANTSYNALQIKVQQNMSHGLQFIAHYTWSRALNYNNGYYAVDPRSPTVQTTRTVLKCSC